MTSCHRCQYDLTGLPGEHRCPECGLSYDAEVRAWWRRATRRDWIQVYIGVTLVAVWVVVNGSTGRIPSTFFWVFLVFWGVATGVNFHRVSRLRALGYVVALHPEGIYVRRENIDRLVRWDEASEVAWNEFFFRMWDKTPIALVLTSGERIQLGEFLPTRAMRAEFVEAFEQRHRPG